MAASWGVVTASGCPRKSFPVLCFYIHNSLLCQLYELTLKHELGISGLTQEQTQIGGGFLEVGALGG